MVAKAPPIRAAAMLASELLEAACAPLLTGEITIPARIKARPARIAAATNLRDSIISEPSGALGSPYGERV